MGTPEKPEFVLFISPTCRFSMSFIEKVKQQPDLSKKFNVVDIDKLPQIPDEVDEIPCVYDGKGIFKGKGAFSWLNERIGSFLAPANDGKLYSFLEGEEKVFNNYSLLDQRNGSYGMGDSPLANNPVNNNPNQGDPTRMAVINDNTNKNRTLDSIMASRSSDESMFKNTKPN
jgi:hypothetical protein